MHGNAYSEYDGPSGNESTHTNNCVLSIIQTTTENCFNIVIESITRLEFSVCVGQLTSHGDYFFTVLS